MRGCGRGRQNGVGVRRLRAPAAVTAAWWLSACAQPIVPTVQVLPGRGKDYTAFQADQRTCSLAANDQIRPLVDSNARAQLGTALISTALGAGLGAAIGGGRGAGIGAAAGALGGSTVATDRADAGQDRIQRFYDNTYASCMASHGDVVQTPAVLVQPAPVLVQPAPYLVQPVPYVVQPAPYAAQPGTIVQ